MLEECEKNKNRFLQEYSKFLQESHEESFPDIEGFASDLFSWVLGKVNWREIAKHKYQEIQDD